MKNPVKIDIQRNFWQILFFDNQTEAPIQNDVNYLPLLSASSDVVDAKLELASDSEDSISIFFLLRYERLTIFVSGKVEFLNLKINFCRREINNLLSRWNGVSRFVY